jgi:hypothetical protein
LQDPAGPAERGFRYLVPVGVGPVGRHRRMVGSYCTRCGTGTGRGCCRPIYLGTDR